MSAMASQITGFSIVCSTVGSGTDQRKHQSSLAFVRGIHWWPVHYPSKGPVTRKILPFVKKWTRRKWHLNFVCADPDFGHQYYGQCSKYFFYKTQIPETSSWFFHSILWLSLTNACALNYLRTLHALSQTRKHTHISQSFSMVISLVVCIIDRKYKDYVYGRC